MDCLRAVLSLTLVTLDCTPFVRLERRGRYGFQVLSTAGSLCLDIDSDIAMARVLASRSVVVGGPSGHGRPAS